MTIFNEQGGRLYDRNENPVDFTTTMRPNHVEQFVGLDEATGMPTRFVTQIHKDLMKPLSQSFRYTRSIPALGKGEGPGTGGVWGGSSGGIQPRGILSSAARADVQSR